MRLLLAAATLLTLACSDGPTTEPGPQTLTGDWVSQRFSLGKSASYEHQLILSRFRRFASEARNYRRDGDRLQFHPVRQVSWDLFYGKSSSTQVIEPYPYSTVFDSARFELVAERLTLRYLSYPFDAPYLRR